MFEKYLAQPEVKQIFEKYFVVVKIDTESMPDGRALQTQYGPPGAPAWAILGAGGKTIADSDDGGGNVGYPAGPRGAAHFAKALKIAVPSISEEELRALTARLIGSKLIAASGAGGGSEPAAPPVTPSDLHEPDGDIGLKTLSQLNAADGAQAEGDQAHLLGVTMFASAQRAMIGTWTSQDLKIEIFTEGTPPIVKVRLPGGTARLHLLWDVDSSKATASAFAVIRTPAITNMYTFNLVGAAVHVQEIVIFTDRSGRPKQINSHDLVRP
jgi:hypothetical protein